MSLYLFYIKLIIDVLGGSENLKNNNDFDI